MYICLLLGDGGLLLGSGGIFWSQFFRSVTMAPAQQSGNHGVVFSLGSVLRVRCCWNVFLLLIIKYKIPGAKRSGREAEIEPELQNDEFIKSRHA
jgi:hypothetical protein